MFLQDGSSRKSLESLQSQESLESHPQLIISARSTLAAVSYDQSFNVTELKETDQRLAMKGHKKAQASVGITLGAYLHSQESL